MSYIRLFAFSRA